MQVVLITVMLIAIALAVYRFLSAPIIGWVNLAIALIAAVLYFALLRYPGHIALIANVLLGMLMAIGATAYLTRVDNAMRLGAFFPILIAAFYLRGFRASSYWLIAILLIILLGKWQPWFDVGYSHFEILAVCLYLVGMFVVIWQFSLLQQDQARRESEFQVNAGQERQLEHIVHHDALTGVPNRVLLADRLAQALARTKREHGLMAVCHLDLDGFKLVNDALGYEVGDRVLVEITRRIKQTIREDDTVARLGGDEFVVLLVGLQQPEECAGSLHRLLEAIARPIEIDEVTANVSASIGVALYPEDEQDADTLLRHADQAMYVAKQSGKNRYHLFDAANDLRARSHHELLQQIRHGLRHGEFELYYQPKMELQTHRPLGAEALVRWHHPQRGLLDPGQFMRAIENTELEVELGSWVIGQALEQIRQWRQVGMMPELSINISAYHLLMPGFAEKLRERLGSCCASPCCNCLQIEVLETVAVEDMDTVGGIIKACKAFGVGFALDDFGTGFSSLTYLNNLAVDTLKIDQSFVRGMLQNKGDHAIVQGIVALASAFDMKVVAEGVEDERVYQALQQMGCTTGQGYGIAPPMPAAELAEWWVRQA